MVTIIQMFHLGNNSSFDIESSLGCSPLLKGEEFSQTRRHLYRCKLHDTNFLHVLPFSSTSLRHVHKHICNNIMYSDS